MSQSESTLIVHSTFVIAGFDGDPAIVTNLLGVEPNASGRAGEKKTLAHGRTLEVRDSFWEIHISLEKESLRLQDYLLAVLKEVEVFASKLAELPPHTTRKILIQSSLSKNGHVPGLYLESAVARRLAALDIDIDIDIN